MSKEEKEKLVPNLRFKGFTDDWIQRKIKKIAPLQRGFDLPKHKIIKGPYPVIFSNGIGGYHTEYKANGPGVVTGRSGSIGNVSFIKDNYWPHNTSLWVTNFFDNYPKYVFYLYQRLNLAQFSTGSGVPTLNRNIVHNQSVAMPKFEEQNRISTLLEKIDNIITLEQEKLKLYEQLKTFIINNILSRKGLSPILFFDSVNKEWKVHKIKEIAALNNNARIPVKESERVPGLIPYYGANGIQDFVEGNTHEGEFALIAEDGANDITDYPSKFVTGKIWVNNHAHVITGYKEVLDTNFFSYLFKTLNIARYLVGSGRWKLNAGTLLEIPIYIPEYNQQLKISSLLNTFDTLIQNGEYKIKNYNRLKNLLLQNLFV